MRGCICVSDACACVCGVVYLCVGDACCDKIPFIGAGK